MMSEACPKCGAVVREDHDSYRRFACMALEFDEVQHLGMHYELRESVDCLRHQLETARAALAQRDERNAALEAEIVELRRAINGIAPTDPTRFEDLDLCVALNNYHDRVEWLPIVRAAMVQTEARDAWAALIDSKASAAYYDATDATETAIRALTPEQRARLEER